MPDLYRAVTIQIWNRTKEELVLESQKIENGEVYDKHNPKNHIGAGQLGTFVCKNKNGHTTGPKGTVTYHFAEQPKAKLVLTWDHPVNDSDSAYNCYGVGREIHAVLLPGHPEGHSQCVNWIVESKEV